MSYEEDLEAANESLEDRLSRAYREIEYLEQELSHYKKMSQRVSVFSDWAADKEKECFPEVERSFKQFQASQKIV